VSEKPIISEPENATSKRRQWHIGRFWPLAVIASALAIFYFGGYYHYLTLEMLSYHHQELKALVMRHPVVAPLVYGLVYTVAAALSFPAVSVLTLFAGFLFGWLVGGFVAVLGATLGGTILFLATRTALGDILRRRAGPSLQKFSDGFQANAFAYMLILRLTPIFPFFLVNIAPGIIGIPVTIFTTATFFGILPGTFAYAWLGNGFERAIANAAADGRAVELSDFMSRDISYAIVAIAVLTSAVFLFRRWYLSRTTART
jgi:uncharacterized membrane protein YdjX (TVP38/TMEM64 family)